MTLVEAQMMITIPFKRLTAEIKLSAATSVAIVAGLIFFNGVWALWSFSLGLEQFRLALNFSILGLIGAPLLIAGNKLGYWYSLINMTLAAIYSVAILTFVAGLVLNAWIDGGPAWAGFESGLMVLAIFGFPLSWMAICLLRSKDVRKKFNV